jgi:hypothetical protein
MPTPTRVLNGLLHCTVEAYPRAGLHSALSDQLTNSPKTRAKDATQTPCYKVG